MVFPHEDASLGVGVTAESDQCPHYQLPCSGYVFASVSSHDIIHWYTSEVADQYHVLIALGKHLGCYLKSRSHSLSVENVLHLWQCIAIIKHWHDVIFVESCCGRIKGKQLLPIECALAVLHAHEQGSAFGGVL